MFIYIAAAMTAFILTYVTTPLVIRFARHFGLVDDPLKRPHPAHTHKGIIPRAGGLALLAGFIVTTIVFVPHQIEVIGILLAAILTVIIGLIDDRTDISPYIRFIGNLVTAGIIVMSGVSMAFITNPLGGVIHFDTIKLTVSIFDIRTIIVWADIAALLWIVWTMNIVGWSSGVDGQMPGFVAITALMLGLLSFRFTPTDVSQQVVALLAFITAGTFLGFLPWNFYPQKIMPGYGGKTLAGLLLSTIAILSGGKVGSALLLLSIPMIDAGYALTRRLMKHKSLFRADRYHLHHRLLQLGWGKRRIALFYWIVSFILGLLTLTINSKQKAFVFIMAIVIVSGILYWISLIVQKRPYDIE